MAFGIKREELNAWKKKAEKGEIAFLTHYWYDERFPHYNTVTKVACCDLNKLEAWGKKYGLKKEWIHKRRPYPHFDLLGENQINILKNEGEDKQLQRFRLLEKKQV